MRKMPFYWSAGSMTRRLFEKKLTFITLLFRSDWRNFAARFLVGQTDNQIFNVFYLQTFGLAMGYSLSPILFDIYKYFVDSSFFYKLPFLCRYVGDTFILISFELDHLICFLFLLLLIVIFNLLLKSKRTSIVLSLMYWFLITLNYYIWLFIEHFPLHLLPLMLFRIILLNLNLRPFIHLF